MDTALAKAKVAPPAIVMMVITGIALLLRGFATIYAAIVGTAMFASMPRGAEGLAGSMIVIIVASIVSLGIGAFCMYGLYKMTQLESWGLSLAAVIVSMIPCIGPCCYFSINTFIGIWALVVLNDAQVKSAFKG